MESFGMGAILGGSGLRGEGRQLELESGFLGLELLLGSRPEHRLIEAF